MVGHGPVKAVLVLMVLIASKVKGAPPKKRQQMGPCVGMDCMHGVLMHGDSEQGHDHGAEDKFRVVEETKEAVRGSDKTGPCQGMDCLHGVLMHGDKETGVEHMHQEVGPKQEPRQAGPGDGMDYLHGVLMHGDKKPGREHDDDHRKLTAPPAGRTPDGPCVGMDCLHGVLMHGDSSAGRDHSAEHEHDKERLIEKLGRKFHAPDPEAAMHGDHDSAGEGHVHSSENKQPVKEEHKGIPSLSDPHEALNGHLNEQFKAPTEGNDDKEYLEWLKVNKNKPKKASDSGGYLGFSFPFISDSLLDEIEILKRRYLPKFWTGSDSEQEQSSKDAEKSSDELGAVHELLSDLEIVGDTAPVKNHHHHQESRDPNPSGIMPEGSGVKHDEG